MNLRKSSYFKPLCLLVAVLFTGQCVTYERKLVSTEEKVIENGIEAYVYKLEKLKNPSAQDPIVEYKIVKFPANRIESFNIYKLKKVNRTSSTLIGFLAGAIIGTTIGTRSMKGEYLYLNRAINGFLIGTVTGATIGYQLGKKPVIQEEIKAPAGICLEKISGSSPIPVQNLPLEFKWGTHGKSNSFKSQTDGQGLVRINLVDDLKMTKVPPDRPLILYIHYLNPVSQLKEILRDSLGPEK